MRKIFLLFLIVAAAAVGAWKYGLFDGASSTDAQAQQQKQSRGAASISVVTAPVKQVDLPIRQRSYGWVEPLQTVAIRSRVVSQLTTQHFTEGQMVKEGDLLFTLDDRELAAQVAKDEAALAKDRAGQARAEADLARYQQLAARNAGTQQQLDVAIADAKSAQATVQGDEAALESDKVRLSFTKIYAPITGRAGSVTLSPGNLVSGGDTSTPLVTLTTMDPIRVTFTLPERELASLQAAMARPGSLPVRALLGDQVIAEGKLVFIDSSIDVSTGTITAKAQFTNPEMKLWPGKYVDVELDTAVHQDALVAPAIAVQQGQKGAYVYVASDDGLARLRSVTTGVSDKNQIEILDGLTANDKVVVDGQLRLTDGAKINVAQNAADQQVSQAAAPLTAGAATAKD